MRVILIGFKKDDFIIAVYHIYLYNEFSHVIRDLSAIIASVVVVAVFFWYFMLMGVQMLLAHIIHQYKKYMFYSREGSRVEFSRFFNFCYPKT